MMDSVLPDKVLAGMGEIPHSVLLLYLFICLYIYLLNDSATSLDYLALRVGVID
jgi:hypothetical protein